MAQRSFSTLLVFAMFILVGIFAFTRGTIPPLDDLAANLLTFVTPIIGVFFTLKTWLDVIDTKVSEGTLKPGEITPLFTMSDFYIAMVACLAGVFQTFGLQVIDENTQAVIVNGLLVVATVLLRSFTDRPPTSTQFVKSQTVTNLKVTAEANTANG